MGIPLDDEAQDIRRALQEVRLFSDVLGSDQLDLLVGDCTPFFFLAGSTLMRQGDFGASMFCITSGTVSLTFVDRLHRRQDIRQLGEGNVVGEIELLTGQRRIATVTAVTNVNALEIAKPALERMFARSPDLVESFGAILAHRQHMLEQITTGRIDTLGAMFAKQIRKIFPL